MSDLSVFLPWTLFERLEKVAGGGTPWETVRGSVLFCDVAGFTPLTEALSAIGREGSEELTRLLNGYFTRMIELIEEEGGDVLRFGGDAMTVLFPGDSRLQALSAASRMMAAMEEFQAIETRAGTFGISMKIGASYGRVLMGILGSEATGRDYYAAGSPLDDAADAEHHASPGLIVCHPTFLGDLPPGVSMKAMEDGYARIEGPIHAPPPVALRPETPSPDVLGAVVPPYLAERAGSGVLGEHRGTSVIFLSFPGLPDDPPGFHESLDRTYGVLAATSRKYGGMVNKVDMGDKGAKAILLFGAPYACEKKGEMAVRAAQDILTSPDLPDGLSLKAGVTSSPLFSGPVGSPARREFTVMGDGINLAARLMQASEVGQALCGEHCVAEASRRLVFQALDPIRVKGKKEPVPIFLPSGEKDEEGTGGKILVERETIQQDLMGYLLKGSGRPLALQAQAGLGKSALLEWAFQEARSMRLPATRITLAPYDRDRPYSAWRSTIRTLLGVGKGAPPETVREAMDRTLADEQPGYRPLLFPLLDLPEETTPALRNLGPKERKTLTFAILGRLLASGGERALLMDNLQWADSMSLELLSFFLQETETPPWRVIVSLRPGQAAADQAADLMKLLPLPPLTDKGLAEVLRRVHGLVEVSKGVLSWFAGRSRGNPVVVEALLKAVEAEGLLVRDAEGTHLAADRLFKTSFPDTLEGLYLARVDHLPRQVREILQAATILGPSVSVNLLKQILGEPEAVAEGLDTLVQEGILVPDSWGNRNYYQFVDSLLRDAVYEALPFAQKREGHLKVARRLRSWSEDESGVWPALAHHFERAGEEEEARQFHRLAGRDSVGRFDNQTALRHLEYACLQGSIDAESIEDHLKLLDVYSALGLWDSIPPVIDRLEGKAGKMSLPHRARLCFFSAQRHWQNQRWDEAERTLLESMAYYQKADDKSGVGKTYVNLVGGVYGPTGRLDQAREVLEKALALPRGPGQGTWRATAANNLGTVLWFQGRTEQAMEILRRAYPEARRVKLGPQQGLIAETLCGLSYETGRFTESIRWGRKAVELYDGFSLRDKAVNARYNLALAYLSAGRAHDVVSELNIAARKAESQGNHHTAGAAHQGLGQAAVHLGRIKTALHHSTTALQQFRKIRNGRDFRFTLIGLGSLYYSLGTQEEAREYWRKQRIEAFLKNNPGDPAWDVGVARIRDWMEGESAHIRSPSRFLMQGQELQPEETLERLFWICEGLLKRNRLVDLRKRIPDLEAALAEWPYFDARLRVLRLRLLAGCVFDGEHRKRALRLLSQCLGGIWGLRLLCALWLRETQGARAVSLRRRALRHLYAIQNDAPAWAWRKVTEFPEIMAVIRGTIPD